MITYTKDGLMVDDTFISLKEIIRNCNIEFIKSETIMLLKIEWKSSRGFDGICETIALPLKVIREIKKHIVGKRVYFGEIAGKHSEIYGTIDESDIKIIDDQHEIEHFLSTNYKGHSYNYSFLMYFLGNSFDEIPEFEMKAFERIYDEYIKK